MLRGKGSCLGQPQAVASAPCNWRSSPALLTISERNGMLKTYELTVAAFRLGENAESRHREREITDYLLDRALRAQGVVSLDSICHLDAPRKPAMRELIERGGCDAGAVPVTLDGAGKQEHWAAPEALEMPATGDAGLVHILSPFDPLIIQRKRTHLIFGYEHRFEAYVPKEKRKLGYFALPVLVGDRIVAALDLKTDRQKRKGADAEVDVGRRCRREKSGGPAQGVQAPDRRRTRSLHTLPARGERNAVTLRDAGSIKSSCPA